PRQAKDVVASVRERDLPAVGGQFARDGDGDDAVLFAAGGLEQPPAGVKAALGVPGGVDDRGGLAAVAALEGHADRGVVAVVVSGLDQESAGVAGSGLGDRALAALVGGVVLGGHEAEVGAQRVGVREAREVADLGAQPDRRQRVDPAQAAQPGDRRGPRRLVGYLGELVLDAVAAGEQDVVG